MSAAIKVPVIYKNKKNKWSDIYENMNAAELHGINMIILKKVFLIIVLVFKFLSSMMFFVSRRCSSLSTPTDIGIWAAF